MMNKKIWIGVVSVTLALGAMGGAATAASNTKTLIGKAEAKKIALKHVDGRIDGVDLERNQTGIFYEVEVERGAYQDEVDVHIDAYSGKLLGIYDSDDDDDDRRAAQATAPAGTASNAGTVNQPAASPSTSTGTTALKTAEQAGAIAVAKVGGTVVKVNRDRDDGRIIYEVDLRITGGKAEVEVDAATGKVLSVDKDYHDDDNDDDDDDDHYDED
ncbi:Peptidase propeptide and YPEB domain-containing protein [Paenibacillus algorifonticola]|uniref:Peptidase propeptide and YPEB domain-containing protein n=1 Tax=Paenibacillus algorifonticola TaxID=684063 RepID=A0A1I2IDN7_9BACL|nr:PepSY domain-containing protein [Paenibacillus algorifonticola]SFF40459.1 Peptidase propeptide and YPEB domain-containing protein [Paenibacillus algorifonticola]